MTDTTRHIPDRLTTRGTRFLRSWEFLLLCVAIAIFVANSFASPYFLNAWNLSDATFNFTEKAIIAFAMAMLIIAGEIDLSVAAIIALASGPMNVTFASVHAAANFGFSLRNPYPGCTASAPVFWQASSTRSITR